MRLGYFGIMTGHVGIWMAKDLGDYINWHPVFYCQGCERMSDRMDYQIFVNLANIGISFWQAFIFWLLGTGSSFPLSRNSGSRSYFCRIRIGCGSSGIRLTTAVFSRGLWIHKVLFSSAVMCSGRIAVAERVRISMGMFYVRMFFPVVNIKMVVSTNRIFIAPYGLRDAVILCLS